jgi:hypothetical protein
MALNSALNKISADAAAQLPEPLGGEKVYDCHVSHGG